MFWTTSLGGVKIWDHSNNLDSQQLLHLHHLETKYVKTSLHSSI